MSSGVAVRNVSLGENMIAGKNNESSPEADTESRSSDQNEISNGLTSEESIEEGKQRETEDEDQEDDYIGDESTEEENTEDVELVENEMPLLKYARLVGSLPRAFSSTTEQDESKDIEADDKAEAVFTTRCTASTFGKHRRHHLLAVGFSNGDLHLVDPVTGLDLISPSFLQVCPQGGHTSKVPGINSVTGISLDAEGRSLAACQRNGNICLWELKYGRDPLATRREGSPASATAGGSSVGVISGSRSVASERHSQSVRSLPALGATTPPRSSVPGTIGGASPGRSNLTSEQVQSQEILSRFGPKIFSPPSALFRFSYGLSSIPTCLALDPARSRKSESRFVVGFADGRIVLTKKGGFWNRRTDAVIYQSSSVARKDDESRANATRRAVSGAGGIDAIIWRGNLIAWADVTGVKLYDVETSQRLAHVDRPAGARSSLYHPSIGTLKCNMCWESPSNLLIAWGDCLMGMLIREATIEAPSAATKNLDAPGQATNSGAGAGGGALSLFMGGNSSKQLPSASSHGRLESTSTASTSLGYGGATIPNRRTVECSMAWELDCVACGVAPMDKDHVVVLGVLSPPLDDQEDSASDVRGLTKHRGHLSLGNGWAAPTVELQIVCRHNGQIVSSDALPLFCHSAVVNGTLEGNNISAAEISLLSSYSVPRMEDRIEREDRVVAAQSGELPSLTITTSESSKKFQEMYERWSIESVTCQQLDEHISCIHEKDVSRQTKRNDPLPVPPIMAVCSPLDVVYVSTRDVDDAVAHARLHGNIKLALLRGFLNRRQLRKISIEELVHEYLLSLLYGNSVEMLLLAAKSCPALLMGNVDLWERWATNFARIPAGLFALREYVPVRDPKLCSLFYEMMLEKMLIDVESLQSDASHSKTGQIEINSDEARSTNDNIRSNQLVTQAKELYFASLRAWGPTSSIREKSRLMKYSCRTLDGQEVLGDVKVLKQLLSDLSRRLHQSAAEDCTELSTLKVLCSLEGEEDENRATNNLLNAGTSGTLSPTERFGGKLDSLYNMSSVASRLAPRILESTGNNREAVLAGISMLFEALPRRIPFSWKISAAVSAEAMAELNFMRGAYVDSLRMYLVLGSRQAQRFDDDAVAYVNRRVDEHSVAKYYTNDHPYHHVCAMIELKSLHWCLMEDAFLPLLSSSVESTPPIVALIHLLGLEMCGRLLVEYCAASHPYDSDASTPFMERGQRRAKDKLRGGASLPMTNIASQLSSRPKLLLWYLHILFRYRADLYVNFYNTAVPPKEVTDLHRIHLEMLVKYSNDTICNTTSLLKPISPRQDSILLSFLRATLPHGGTRPEYARRLLNDRRSKIYEKRSSNEAGAELPENMSQFALELAFVIEKSGDLSIEDAKRVLMLYVEGAKSLASAVQFADSSHKYSTVLWEKLVTYCLESDKLRRSETKSTRRDGDRQLFGALLQAAALCGTDLANLVSQIPKGMRIKGLRPMLVAAVADYRARLLMHKKSSAICFDDKVSLLREGAHRSKRATRVQYIKHNNWDITECANQDENLSKNSIFSFFHKKRKDRALYHRRFRAVHAVSVPIR